LAGWITHLIFCLTIKERTIFNSIVLFTIFSYGYLLTSWIVKLASTHLWVSSYKVLLWLQSSLPLVGGGIDPPKKKASTHLCTSFFIAFCKSSTNYLIVWCENICRDPFASASKTKKRVKIEIANCSAINYW